MAAVALMLGGGGLVAANVYASASEGGWGGDTAQQGSPDAASDGATIDCPDVGTQLTTVPDEAKTEVDNQLALLDQQITEAYQKLKDSQESIRQDASFADNAIMNPLKEKRAATLGRIGDAIARVGDRPEGLDALAGCTLIAPTNGDQNGNGDDQSASPSASAGTGDQGGQGQQQSTNGPVASDYADITSVQPNVNTPQDQANASRGTFVTACGVNENGLFNSDNVIVAPGVTNGAHHFHDYIGNQSNNAFASDQDLANADTSCENPGDKSTYYWPVLRLQNGKQEQDADKPGGGTEGNSGQIVTAKAATLTFVGNPQSKVVAMPRLLRIITGDAKAFVNGPANANASWSCTGFEDRQLKDKYPLCPAGSDVVRTFKFQSCWDGRNIDSANHRTHVAFEAADGSCPAGFEAIPQLVQRIVYDVDAPSLQDGGKTTPLFAVDSFPEQQHKPVTDHGDFINVFDEGLMKDMVDCINNGEKCGAGTDNDPGSGDGSGSGGGSGDGSGGGQGAGGGSGEPSASPTATDTATAAPTDTATDEPAGNGGNEGNGGNAGNGDNGGNGDQPTADPATSAPDTGANAPEPTDTQTTDPGDLTTAVSVPKADTKTEGSKSTETQGSSDNGSGGQVGTPAATPPDSSSGGESYAAVGPNQPQAQGGLAETGANLWPAVAGALLLVAGFVVLYRGKRSTR
ncbi:DUF1996 domain-containing protein [Streptomyces sp. MBT65]|uniref:DUF1996 domain-containing protein n=1 Tax=Streptomyces sp. MBT65 TaxID=1488395 RepID=UPI00190CF821|nr:DUF1996 domain-containing protein [Streptomyces sp. MBT65]MBK3576200.1 DUF1996 domain-containing protein [Streptomyces sp. MBT65]